MTRSRIGPVLASVVDLDVARSYLASVGGMCSEGATSPLPTVVLLALRVLEKQRPLVRALIRRIG